MSASTAQTSFIHHGSDVPMPPQKTHQTRQESYIENLFGIIAKTGLQLIHLWKT